jgi:2-oxo-4-hydroxy-4-carboxy--5-ureidoimidazoline (OHCU) decarboxylase
MRRIVQLVGMICIASGFGSLLCIPSAAADMIGTKGAISAIQSADERERVKALMARPEIAKQLQAMGLPLEQAQARVDALTDQEVQSIATNLNALPSGGNFSEFQWIVIVIGAVIIALLL